MEKDTLEQELQKGCFIYFFFPSELLEATGFVPPHELPSPELPSTSEELGWICTEAGASIGCNFKFLLRISTISSSWKVIPQQNPFCVVLTVFTECICFCVRLSHSPLCCNALSVFLTRLHQQPKNSSVSWKELCDGQRAHHQVLVHALHPYRTLGDLSSQM